MHDQALHLIARSVDDGGLSALARDVGAEELARRILGDDVDYVLRPGSPAWRLLDRAGSVLVASAYLVALASVLGLVR
jgi:hypothetical protein